MQKSACRTDARGSEIPSRDGARQQLATQISDWELNKFRQTCEAEAIYDRAALRSNERIWEIIDNDHVDEAVYDIVRLALHEAGWSTTRDECRKMVAPKASPQAVAAEWSAPRADQPQRGCGHRGSVARPQARPRRMAARLMSGHGESVVTARKSEAAKGRYR